MSFLLVGLGGALGAMARYGLGRLIGVWPNGWPMATFVTNISGGLLMGLLSALLLRLGGEQARLLLGVGVLGGFTTFSAFSLEAVQMIERRQWTLAGAYVAASTVVAIVALFAGLTIARRAFA